MSTGKMNRFTVTPAVEVIPPSTSDVGSNHTQDARNSRQLDLGYLYRDSDYTYTPRMEDVLRGALHRPAPAGIGDGAAEVRRSLSPMETDEHLEEEPEVAGANMGVLVGVYLPCIQNIFGVLLFIRLTWIVGAAGITQSFLLVFICCCLTFLTAISMSAIATNGVVPAGGSYFMISRALGPEFGGAVGLLFYLGTTTSSAMYIIGAVEILLTYLAPDFSLFGPLPNDEKSIMVNNFRVYGCMLLVLIGSVVLVGVRVVNKFAALALCCVLLSILALFVGYFYNAPGKNPLLLCSLGERLLKKEDDIPCAKFITNDTTGEQVKTMWWQKFCVKENVCDPYFLANNFSDIQPIPGLASGVISENAWPQYYSAGEIVPGVTPDDRFKHLYIIGDIETSFAILLGIFFPSVTGIMAGSNRSGDLADAQNSIPKGTLLAILTTSFVYLSSVVLMGGSLDGRVMRDKFGASIGPGGLIVSQLSWPHPYVILVGALLSTIGAGMQALTGAPRLLQAIASDDIIPALQFLNAKNKCGEPHRAIILTAAISSMGILIGDLDKVTPIITMFFIMCYLFVNIACALQSLLHSPSWRPRFRYYHWSTALLGSVLCITIMFITSWYFAIGAMAIAALIYLLIKFFGARKEWGDGVKGLAMSAAMWNLLRLEQDGEVHVKNWRPQILVLCKLDDEYNQRHIHALAFASQLKEGQGLAIVASVLQGKLSERRHEVQQARTKILEAMSSQKLKGFAEVIVTEEVTTGLNHLIQACGLGALRPNTVLLGWPYDWQDSAQRSLQTFFSTVNHVADSKQALMVTKGIKVFPSNGERLRQGTVDVWWIVHDGGLLILLSFLLTKHKVWKKCRIRIFTVAQECDDCAKMEQDLKNLVYNMRIEADVAVLEMPDTEIQPYVYERTMMLEERKEFMSKMYKNSRKTLDPQLLMDEIHRTSKPATQTSDNHRQPTRDEKPKELQEPAMFECAGEICSKEEMARQLHTATALNKIVVQHSQNAQLVILNLPTPPHKVRGFMTYMEFIEVLTANLKRVLMVRGSGREVITMYS